MKQKRKKKLLTEMSVTLTNEKKEKTTLVYQIRSIAAAQIWAKCIHYARRQSCLCDRDRFDNFPNSARGSLENLLKILNSTIEELKTFHPELEFPPINLENLQGSVNYLHFHFAHSHHVTKVVGKHNLKLWSTFNTILHAIENRISSKDEGLPNAAVFFTWLRPLNCPIPEKSYENFCLNLEFGTAYSNYSQVGRHFAEMFWNEDDHLDDAHIRPSNSINGDTLLWFGPSQDHLSNRHNIEKIKTWFLARRERFEKLGWHWGDPKLALGFIPVARLKESLHTEKEINEFVNFLSRFTLVKEVQVS